jgi:PBSX family phage terminase large subunit
MKINAIYHEFIDDTIEKNDFLVFQGGKRAGKTVAILQKLYLKHIEKKKRSIICADTFSRLKDSILSDWKFADEVAGVSKIIYSGTPRIEFYNGSLIEFTYAGKDTRGFTSDKDYILFNEAIMYEETTVRDLLKAGGNNCKVFFDYNPYNRFYVNDKYENGSNKLITTYKDNAFVPEFAKRQLAEQEAIGISAKEGTLERYLYEVECAGIDSVLSGLIFKNYDTCSDADYDRLMVPEILGADWGQTLSTADPDCVIGVKITQSAIYVKEYYYANDGKDEDIAKALNYVSFKDNYFVYETATAGEMRIKNIYNASGLRFKFVPATKGKGSVIIGIRNIDNVNRKIIITDTSKNVQYERENYKWVVKGGVMQPSDKYNHAFDTLRYIYDFYINNLRLFV